MMIVDGVEHFYLKDMDVELKDKAVAGDPIIGNRFEGVALWVHSDVGRKGELSTWIDFQYQEDGPMHTTAIPTWTSLASNSTSAEPTTLGVFDLNTAIELPSTRIARFRSMLQVPSDTWRLLGVQRLPGTDRALLAALRVSRQASHSR